jgi:hypothetical protein
MPTFKFIHRQVHRVDLIFSEEFDTASQDDWDALLSMAASSMDEDEFAALPDDPPDDIDIWLKVYSFVDTGEFSDSEEDWVTVRKGGYESYILVTDEDGNVLSEG